MEKVLPIYLKCLVGVSQRVQDNYQAACIHQPSVRATSNVCKVQH